MEQPSLRVVWRRCLPPLHLLQKSGTSPSRKSLSIISFRRGVIPIPGCRSVSQVEDNIGAMGWRLTELEVAMLELEADKLGRGQSHNPS